MAIELADESRLVVQATLMHAMQINHHPAVRVCSWRLVDIRDMPGHFDFRPAWGLRIHDYSKLSRSIDGPGGVWRGSVQSSRATAPPKAVLAIGISRILVSCRTRSWRP